MDEADALEDKIKKARAESETHGNVAPAPALDDSSEASYADSKPAYEFIGSVMGGAVLGFGLDWAFGTKPYAIIICVFLGFISGTYRVQSAAKRTNSKIASKKPPP